MKIKLNRNWVFDTPGVWLFNTPGGLRSEFSRHPLWGDFWTKFEDFWCERLKHYKDYSSLIYFSWQARSMVIFSSTHKYIWSRNLSNWAKNTAFFISCRNSCVNTSKEQSVLPLFWANLVQTKHCFGGASVTGIVKNVLGTSLLCHERSWNVAPLQPRLFVARWPKQHCIVSAKKRYNAKLS